MDIDWSTPSAQCMPHGQEYTSLWMHMSCSGDSLLTVLSLYESTSTALMPPPSRFAYPCLHSIVTGQMIGLWPQVSLQ